MLLYLIDIKQQRYQISSADLTNVGVRFVNIYQMYNLLYVTYYLLQIL